MRKTAAAVFLVLSASTVPAVAQAPESINLSPAEALTVARQALNAGDLSVAADITDAFIRADRATFDVLMIRAIVAERRGNRDLARRLSADAYGLAATDGQRFDAAWLAANVAGGAQRWEAAKLWLRRADQVAADDAQRGRVENAFRRARAESPLAVQLSFSLRPSDNLNNGSDPNNTDDGVFLTGSTEAKVGGVEATGSVSLTYRLSEGRTQRTEAYFQSYVRLAFPNDLSEKIPDASRREFDYVSLAAGITHRRLLFSDLGATTFRIGGGGSYYRNEDLARFVTFSIAQDFALSDVSLVRVELAARREDRIDSPTASYDSRSLAVDWFGRTEGGTRLSFGATVTDFVSDGATVKGQRYDLRARADIAQAWRGVRPDVAVAVSYRDMTDFFNPLNAAAGVGREDLTTRLTLGLTLADRSWYGFVPRVELTGSITNSDRDLWDRRSFGVGATLVSRF